MRNYFGLILLVFFSSCARLVFYQQGIKSIKMQNASSLRSFMQKQGIDTSNVFLLKSDYLLPSLNSSLNRAFIYDKRGDEILYEYYAPTQNCPGNVMNFLSAYQKTDSLVLDRRQSFASNYNQWISLDGAEASHLPLGADLTVVYYWNTFTGKYKNRKFIHDIEKIVQKRPDLEIVFYKVNQDYRNDIDFEKYFREQLEQADSLKNQSSH